MLHTSPYPSSGPLRPVSVSLSPANGPNTPRNRLQRPQSHQPSLATYNSQAPATTTNESTTSPVVVDYSSNFHHELAPLGAGRFWRPDEDNPRSGFLQRKLFRRSAGSMPPPASGSAQPMVSEVSLLEGRLPAGTPPPYQSQVSIVSPALSNGSHHRTASIASDRSSRSDQRASRSASIHTTSSNQLSFPALNASEQRRSLAHQISRDERARKTIEQLRRLQDMEDARVAQFETVCENESTTANLLDGMPLVPRPAPRPVSQISSVSSIGSSVPDALRLTYTPQNEAWISQDCIASFTTPRNEDQVSNSPESTAIVEPTELSAPTVPPSTSSQPPLVEAPADYQPALAITPASPQEQIPPHPTLSLSLAPPSTSSLSTPDSTPSPLSTEPPSPTPPTSLFSDLNLLRASLPRRHSRSTSSPLPVYPFPISTPSANQDRLSMPSVAPPVELSASNSVIHRPKSRKIPVHERYRRQQATRVDMEMYNTLPSEPYPIFPREEAVEVSATNGEEERTEGEWERGETREEMRMNVEPDIDPRTNLPWDSWAGAGGSNGGREDGRGRAGWWNR